MSSALCRTSPVAILLAAASIAIGQSTQPVAPASATPTLLVRPPMTAGQASSMVLGPGDVVNISVSNSPEFAMKLRVEANGDVTLPYLGVQHFGGQTVDQIQRSLTQQLKDQQYFNDPQVLIFVEQFTSQTISVLGEVNQAGAFPGIGDHTLGELIADAQGMTQLASNHILIYRRNQPDPIPVTLDGTDASTKFPVYAGDVIRVQKSGLVYVVGAVKTPNAYPLPTGQDINVVQALTLGGGALRTAKRGEIHIVRMVNNERVDIPIDLGKVLSGKQEDPTVRADDIVYVPDSYAKIIAAGSAGVIGAAILATTYLK